MDFYKFDGAGNDFVVIDARNGQPTLTAEMIAHICHRRRGVGADGLMMLASANGYDFAMRYYNADGLPADMCGNGGRCLALFAHLLGLGREVDGEVWLRFVADDGEHMASIVSWDVNSRRGLVRLGMREVAKASLRPTLQGLWLNTGVPHYVQQVSDIDHYDVAVEGKRLRHHPGMGPDGANIDFVEPQSDGTLVVRTYERGVEDETWACGTGVTAAALATGIGTIRTRGGDFKVTYDETTDTYTNIWLTGPVSYNFRGEL